MKVSLNSSVYTTYINKNFKWKPANSDPDLPNRYTSPHQFHMCLSGNFLSGRTEYLGLSLPTQQHGYSSFFSTFILSQASLYPKVSASSPTALCGPSTPLATWEAATAESLKSGEDQRMQQQTRCVTQEPRQSRQDGTCGQSLPSQIHPNTQTCEHTHFFQLFHKGFSD